MITDIFQIRIFLLSKIEQKLIDDLKKLYQLPDNKKERFMSDYVT